MTRTRMHRTFTNTCATTSYIIISILIHLCITSPYDSLHHGTTVGKEHASSAQADYDPSSSKHELNALVVHHQHSHRKETWTRGKRLLNKRLLRLHLTQPRLLWCSRLHRRHYRDQRHLQLLLWDLGAHTPPKL